MNLPAYVRWPLGALLVAHGAIHALGFIAAFEIAQVDSLGGPTLFLAGLESGHPAILAFGLLWLVATLAFVAAGVGVALRTPWSLPLVGAAAGLSLVPSIVWWNDAWIGALLSGALLVAIAVIRPRLDAPRWSGPGRGHPSGQAS